MVIAHRGASGYVPENTVKAYRVGADRVGGVRGGMPVDGRRDRRNQLLRRGCGAANGARGVLARRGWVALVTLML